MTKAYNETTSKKQKAIIHAQAEAIRTDQNNYADAKKESDPVVPQKPTDTFDVHTYIPPGGFIKIESPIIGTGNVGDFANISGSTLTDVLSRVPVDATIKPFQPDSYINDGIRISWTENGVKYDLWAHEANPNAPSGSNSSQGWTVRIRKYGGDTGGKYYMNSEGQWVKENALNPNSPNYDPYQANSTHIKIQDPYDDKKDDDNNPPSSGGSDGRFIIDEFDRTYKMDEHGNYRMGTFDANGEWYYYEEGTEMNPKIYFLPINPSIPIPGFNFSPIINPIFAW